MPDTTELPAPPSPRQACPAALVLEDGSTFEGELVGAPQIYAGEVCFNTSHSGYQEVLTDPSYRGQIVTMTATQVGNYGTNPADVQSLDGSVQVAGFLVRDLSRIASNYRSTAPLDAYLAEAGVGIMSELDTRKLTRHLRDRGAMRGAFGPLELGSEALLEAARAQPSMSGLDLASQASTRQPVVQEPIGEHETVREVTVVDFGVKRGILESLRQRGCRLTIVPSSTPAAELLGARPDGILMSNGPGDPEAVASGIEIARALVAQPEQDAIPVLGICLGHQILALGCGARTFKLKFGHRGSNHPVRELTSDRIAITAQNHGFAVDPESLPECLEVTHLSCNDGTIEGLAHRSLPIVSVQHHPEASPGPHDAWDVFDRFLAAMAT